MIGQILYCGNKCVSQAQVQSVFEAFFTTWLLASSVENGLKEIQTRGEDYQ